MTQQARPRSENFITRFETAYEAWCKKHLPDWLYKIAIMHPARFGHKPSDKPLNKLHNALVYLGIVAVVILLIVSAFT